MRHRTSAQARETDNRALIVRITNERRGNVKLQTTETTHLFDLLDVPGSAGRTAIVWNDEPITYEQLQLRAREMAAVMQRRGVGRGDIVTIVLPNAPSFVVAYFACWYLGAVANPFNTRLGASELREMVVHAGSKLLITGPTHAAVSSEALEMLSAPLPDQSTDVDYWELDCDEAVTAPGVHPGDSAGAIAGGGADAAVLIYTSGTTSAPKGVLLSHRNLLADAGGLADRLGIDRDYRTLCFMPLFHCNALIFSHLTSFTVGASVVLQRKFSVSDLWTQLESTRANSFSCPPTVLAMLLARTPADRPTPPELRFVKVGAAPLAESLAEAFEQRFGVPLIEGYGMTEGTATSVMHDPRLGRIPGTAGFPLRGQKLRIVDQDGNPLPPGELGEIQLAGPTIMLGYHRAPHLTEQAVVDGWLKTGDLGSMDASGNLSFAGRHKEIIIRGGENILPQVLDEVIEQHPGVRDGAAYGVPDPIWGEVPAVAVVSEGALDLTDLAAFVRARVADFQAPQSYRLVDVIPRNALGKVQRHVLQAGHGKTEEMTSIGEQV